MRNDDFIGQQFCWFTGVVEDITDPEKMNRVKVRCHGYHDLDILQLPKDNLPWATVMMPSTSQSSMGYGRTHELEVGSWVVGFFRDGQSSQDPLVMGSIATSTGGTIDLPIESREEVDADPLAEVALQTGNNNYPNNKVYKSAAGHIVEFDNGVFHPEVPEVPGIPAVKAWPAQVKGALINPQLRNPLNPFGGDFDETSDLHERISGNRYTEDKPAVEAVPAVPAIPAVPAFWEGSRIHVKHNGGTEVSINSEGDVSVIGVDDLGVTINDNIAITSTDGNININANGTATDGSAGQISVYSQGKTTVAAEGDIDVTSYAGQITLQSPTKTRIM